MGRFSNSPQAGDLTSSFGTHLGHPWSSLGAWWGDSLIHPRLDISHRHSACVGEILLLAPGWTSLIIVQRVVGRFSYSPQAGHLWSSFGAWWGDSLTRPRLDMLFCAWWGDSITRPRLDISCRGSACGGEILLLAPGWTSLVVVWCVVGRFSYSPKAGHFFYSRSVRNREVPLLAPGYLSWSFDACWGDSLTRPRLEISHRHLAHGGEIHLLTPGWTSLVVAWRMVGRFSYSPQAGHVSRSALFLSLSSPL